MIILFLTILFFAPTSSACIWQSSEAPYWPSNTIRVCFVKPAAQSSPQELAARNIIREAVVNQFNARTLFRFTRFDDCTSTRAGQTPEPMVRINMLAGVGSSSVSQIGPGAALQSPNINLDILELAKSNGEAQALRPTNNIHYALIHEMMHLLGIHHEEIKQDQKQLNANPNLVTLSPYDAQSVSRGGPSEGRVPRFSAGDVECLRRIATRTMPEPESPVLSMPYNESSPPVTK